MKRTLTSFVLAFSFIVALATPVAATSRYWRVQMFEPKAETASQQLRITYNVQSTVASDTFNVVLRENGDNKASNTISTPNGDSAVFTIDIPSTGTYTYNVVATNNGDGSSKSSSSYTVEVVEEESENVVTVAPAAQNAAVGGGAGAGDAAQGQVAQAATTDDGVQAEGQTQGENDESAASQEDDSDEDGEVLGEEGVADRVSNSAPYLAIVAVIAILGYLLYRSRQAVDAE